LPQFPDDCEKEDFRILRSQAGRVFALSDTRVKQELLPYFG